MAEAGGSAQKSAVMQDLPIVAPGPIYQNRKLLVAKFQQLVPEFKDSSALWRLIQDTKEDKNKGRTMSSGPKQKGWALERKPGEMSQQGTLDTFASGAPNVFVMVKSAGSIQAFPVDQVVAFKPVIRRKAVTLEEAERSMAQQRAQADAAPSMRLAPRSVRQAEEQRVQMEKDQAELLKLELGLVSAPSGAAAGGAKKGGKGGRGRKGRSDDLDEDMQRLFGSDDEDEDDDEDLDARVRRAATKARPRGKGGKGGKQAAGGAELDEDELPEDIYEGEHDELRPDKPEPAEDWDHEQECDDDDEDMGASDAELEDDPGERKKLGLEAKEGEEEEEGPGEGAGGAAAPVDRDRAALLKRLEAEDDEFEDYEGEDGGEAGPSGADEGPEDEDLDLDEILEKDATLRSGLAAVGRGRGGPAAGAGGKPPAPGQPKRGRDTGLDDQMAKRQRQVTPPQGGPKARMVTPPSGAAGAGAAAAGGSGPVTTDDVKELLRQRGGRMKLQDLKTFFRSRCTTDALREQLKAVLRAVAQMDKDAGGVSWVVLKQ